MSGPEIVHPVAVDALEGWMASLRTALLGDPASPEAAARLHNRRLTWQPDRVWGVRDRGAWVGSLATEDRTLTVPAAAGGTNLVAVDALTGVSVAATHRRQGLLRSMLDDSLRTARDRGDALSVLIAAEWPIYGRFGYAPATVGARYRYFPRRAGAAPAGGPARGMRPLSAAEAPAVATDVFERSRRRTAGQMDRGGAWWPRQFGTDGFRLPGVQHVGWYAHEDAEGVPDGLVGWYATRSLDLDGTAGAVTVELLAAASDAAYRDLWAYLAGIDLAGEITLDQRPIDEPIRWLLGDGRALQQYAAVDELWVRLLDVPAALSARGYSSDGDLVLDVIDADGAGHAAGRFRLRVDGGVASCAATTDTADLRVTQRALASAYLGGHRLRTLAIGGGVVDLTPGALDRADLLFATPTAPWNSTHF